MNKFTYKILIVFVLFCLPNLAIAQGQFTNMGTDFIMGFPNNYNNPYIGGYEQGLHLELKIVTSKPTHVKITYHFDNTVEEFDVAADKVHPYVLTDAQRNKVYSQNDGTDLRTFRIETDEKVTVYAISLIKYTTDATAVLPVNNWGKEYVHLGADGSSSDAYKSGFAIIAKEDDTYITVAGGTPFKLNKNQIYRNSLSGGDAALGHRITATKDIAMFTTHVCTTYPNGACDHQLEQLVPIANFGKEFLVPKAGMSHEIITIATTENNTKVTMRSGTSAAVNYTINAGQQYHYGLTHDTYITADKQIAVLAHIGGTGYSCGGDPATAWVPPIEQNINRAYIAPFSTSKSAIKCHYILLMTKTTDKGQTKINGATPSAGWRDHPSGYSVLTYNMPSLIPYEIMNDKGVVVLAFGIGPTESYYYLAASSARKLDASFTINGKHYQDANLSTPFDCGTPFNFEATIQYELHAASGRLKWYIDGVEEVSARDKLTWTKPYLSGTNHTVKLVVKDVDGVEEVLETTLVVECATGISPAAATIYEGDEVELTIALGAGTTPVDVTFAIDRLSSSSAQPTDYIMPASVKMLANTSEIKFKVKATEDYIINESDIVLKLKASAIGYPDMNADITIKDKSTAAMRELSLKANNLTIYEPAGTPTSSQITISLPTILGNQVKSAIPLAVNLNYSHMETTATLGIGNDYSLNPTTAATQYTLPANANSASYTLTAQADKLLEVDEFVKVVASAPAGHTMKSGENSVTITIKDQTDGSIIVVKQTPSGNASENPLTHGSFRIKFKDDQVKSVTRQVKVKYSLSGSSQINRDHTITPTPIGEATIPIMANYVDVVVNVVNNFVVQGDHELNIEISDPEFL